MPSKTTGIEAKVDPAMVVMDTNPRLKVKDAARQFNAHNSDYFDAGGASHRVIQVVGTIRS